MASDLVVGLRDCWSLGIREIRHVFRHIDGLLTSLILPVLLLLMFTYLFGGGLSQALPSRQSYLEYVTPGILIMAVCYCASTTAARVSTDWSTGFVERLRSMPIVRPAFLVSHIMAAMVRNVGSLIVALGVAVLLGYRVQGSWGDTLVAGAILLGFAVALTSLAVLIGVMAPSPDAASTYTMLLMILPYFSGAFVPLGTMPTPLRVVCQYQPMNTVWTAVSELVSGQMTSSILGALAWCIGLTIGCLVISSILFNRKAVP